MRRSEATGGRWVALTPEIVAADPTRLALLADLAFQGRYRSLLSGHMR